MLQAAPSSMGEAAVQSLLMKAAVDLMPGFARRLHGLSAPIMPAVIRGATLGVAQTLRWAFAGEEYRQTH